jgi:hypothetical protein
MNSRAFILPSQSFLPSAEEMANIRNLLSALAAKEDALRGTLFVAPCVGRGTINLRGGGLVYSFTPEPDDFEGWGVFEPLDERTAVLVAEASPSQRDGFLKSCKTVRLRLSYRLKGQTWLACPVNEADARGRLGTRKPQQLHLVENGAQFEQVVARFDGSSCWFEEIDRRADPRDAERMRRALRDKIPPAYLGWKNCTPEMRGCYVQAQQQGKSSKHMLRQLADEQRLQEALAFSGGQLISFSEEGNCWKVLWRTRDERSYASVISKQDLTVLSAGFCLSGLDGDFDLQSLVTVAEAADGYW